MKILSTLFALCLFSNSMFAQNMVGDTLVIEAKSGKVAKYIKKNGMSCRNLKITGEIDNEDLLALTLNAGALGFLDFSEATIKVTDRRYTNDEKWINCDLDFRSGSELTIKLTSKGIYKKTVLPVYYELRSGSDTKFRVLANKNNYIKSILAGTSILNFYDGQASSNIPQFDILEVNDESLYKTFTKKEGSYEYKCCMIVNTTNGDVIINWWKPIFGIKYLEDAIKICPYSIHDCKYSSITFKRLKELGEGVLFNLQELKTVRFPVLEKVTGSFCNTQMEKVVLPSTLKSIDKEAFRCSDSKIKTIEFLGMQPPTCLGYNKYTFWYLDILVPKGSLSAYMSAFGNVESHARIHENGASNRYTIHSETPGSMSQLLTTEICQNAEYLTITGQVYDTEKKIVEQKAQWLKSTDWSGATVVKSPETLADEKVREERSKQWEKDRPKREADEKKLAEKRRKYGAGSVSEGYKIGYGDGYRGVNNYWSYVVSDHPLYTEGFLSGYIQGFDAGSNDRSKADLERMRNL